MCSLYLCQGTEDDPAGYSLKTKPESSSVFVKLSQMSKKKKSLITVSISLLCLRLNHLNEITKSILLCNFLQSFSICSSVFPRKYNPQEMFPEMTLTLFFKKVVFLQSHLYLLCTLHTVIFFDWKQNICLVCMFFFHDQGTWVNFLLSKSKSRWLTYSIGGYTWSDSQVPGVHEV